MRSVLQFLAITALFVGINVLAAGLLFGAFRAGQVLAPGLMESAWFVYPLGFAMVALTLWVVARLLRAIPRLLSRDRARARA